MQTNPSHITAWLEQQFGSNAALGVQRRAEIDDGQLSVFPCGTMAAIPSNWADKVRAAVGADRVTIFEMAPDSVGSPLATEFSQHTFAVVDDRFIVDGWMREWGGFSTSAVFDLENPAHAGEILRLYGPRERWEEISATPTPRPRG